MCKKEMLWITKNEINAHSILAFASIARQCSSHPDHSSCDDEECNATPKASGPPAHTHNGCKCDLARLSVENQKKLHSLIMSGRIPMLMVEEDKSKPGVPGADMNIEEFVGGDAENACIAISHVWSDLLGNPKENSMPACQLLRLQKTVSDVATQGDTVILSSAKGCRVGFWIDTICVPHEADVTNQALGQMYDIYRESTAVLVLDSRLRKMAPEDGWQLCLWQIFTSVWSQRLWTLLEGILNEHTFFAFKDDFGRPRTSLSASIISQSASTTH
jgi:hypothetical protein